MLPHFWDDLAFIANYLVEATLPTVTRMPSIRSLSRRRFLAGDAAMAGFAMAPPRPTFATAEDRARILRAAPAEASLRSSAAVPARVWAYDEQVPGPLLRVRQGKAVRVRLENDIEQSTTIHWHGIRIDNRMDGVAGLTQDAVPPGEAFEYAFTVPDAGTFWYHPHNRSWEQVARGLQGVLIVDEPEPPAVDQDIVLVVDDWRLTKEGQIDEASFGHLHDWSHAGRLGNELTINGRPRFDVPVRAGERLRVRVVNTANARIMNLRFEKHGLTLIAVDGQPVEPRLVPDGAFPLGPGQRVDLMIDMSLDPGSRAAITEVTGGGRLVAGEFIYAAGAVARVHPLDAPVRLAANPLPTRLNLDDAARVDLLMEGGAMGGMAGAIHEGKPMTIRELVREKRMAWAFNGVAGMSETPLVSAKRGETVVIHMRNQTAWPHAMNLHGHHVRELARSGVPVADEAWRDPVMLEREEDVAVALVADNPGKWMLHCHMLEHQAAGMTTWFEVV